MTEISSTTGKANTLGERFFDQGYLFPLTFSAMMRLQVTATVWKTWNNA